MAHNLERNIRPYEGESIFIKICYGQIVVLCVIYSNAYNLRHSKKFWGIFNIELMVEIVELFH